MYPGGKGNAYQKLINEIPPHDVYIALFMGHDAIMKHKRPARINIGTDLDERLYNEFATEVTQSHDNYMVHFDALPENIAKYDDGVHFVFLQQNALDFLQKYNFTGREFIYTDPPYLMHTRRKKRPLYTHEFCTEQEHTKLLNALINLPCNVMISGYRSKLYNQLLAGWRTITYQSKTRGGPMATECIWMNYPEPSALHDYQYLGDDFRERERIKRKAARWAAGLDRLPELEKKAILSQILYQL